METIGITDLRAKLSEDFVRDLDGLLIINRRGQTIGQITGQAYQPPVVASDPRTQAHQVGIAAPTSITPAVEQNTDPRVPPNTGSAHPVNTRGVRPRSVAKASGVWTGPRGLSKADQASGKSRMKG